MWTNSLATLDWTNGLFQSYWWEWSYLQLNYLCRPAQLAFQGTYKGLIELLIVHANEIFPSHPDDEEDEAEDTFDEIDDSEEYAQTSGKRWDTNWLLRGFSPIND